MTSTGLLPDNSLKTFDIRNFTEQLTPAKEKNKYICPVCEGHNLGINPSNGKYQCFNNCQCPDIREAIKPWSEVLEENKLGYTQQLGLKPLKAKKPAALPKVLKLDPSELRICRLRSEITTPQPNSPDFVPKSVTFKLSDDGATPKELKQITVIEYDYGNGRKAHRFECPCAAVPKGRVKTFSVSRIDPTTNKTTWKKEGYWPAYKQDEAIEILKSTDGIPVLLAHEGEKCVEASRLSGLASITWVGNCSDGDILKSLTQIKHSTGKDFLLAYCADHDETGWKKQERIKEVCAQAGVAFVAIDLLKIKPDLQNKGDVADILADGMTGDELANLLLRQIEEITADAQSSSENVDSIDVANFAEEPDSTFLQKGFNTLYGDRKWICADGKLYCWDGLHYQHSPDSVERPRITNYCNSYQVIKKTGKNFVITHPYAKPSKVKELLEWVKLRVEIDPQLLNPPGVNCTNGVLGVDWAAPIPQPVLEEHDPDKHFFTYPPLVKYDPQADPRHCDRLLSCLDSPQQQVLLRNLGASLDLEVVRKKRGRESKLLLACGLGSNGKDSIREVVSIIYGNQGMTSCSLADFAAYDEGRKFSLFPLVNSRVNWASENPQTARLDKIQSLKLFATGNVLHSERKGKDHIEFNPKGIGIFNLNETPALHGTIQAITDRIAALVFSKTFKSNPDPNNPNELLADPRFSYDLDFVRECVAPAFLNKMIAGLQALIKEGIDYSCTQQALEDIQAENSHLFQFSKDTGLGYKSDAIVTAFDLWSRLENWYIDNGTLSFDESSTGKVKAIWQEQSKPSDKTVKAINQVIARFKTLFPKAKLVTVPHPSGKRKLQALQGISFHDVPMSTTGTPIAISENSTADPPQPPHQEILINQDFHTNHTSLGDLEKKSTTELNIDLNTEPNTSSNTEPNIDLNTSSNIDSSDQNQITPPIVSPANKENDSKLVWVVCDDVAPSTTADLGGVSTAVPDELIAMPNSLLTTVASGEQAIDDLAGVYPQDDATVLQQETNVQQEQEPNGDTCDTPLNAGGTDKIIANAELIKECIVDESWQMIDELIEEWTDEFKSAVWKELTPLERKTVKQLKRGNTNE
ncbi:MAG: DNA primase family protein [Nostoc sp.]